MNQDFLRVQIIPPFIDYSWKDIFNDKFSALYGYNDDIKNKGLDSTLKDIFDKTFEDSQGNKFSNLISVANYYWNYLLDIQDIDIQETNVKNSNSEYSEFIKELNPSSLNSLTSSKLVEIAKKLNLNNGVLTLLIPLEKITQDYAFIMGEDKVGDIKTISQYDKELLNEIINEDFVPSEKYLNLQDSKRLLKSKTNINLDVNLKIIVFAKSKNKFIEITKFASYVTTNVTHTGGNFEINLPFFTSEDNIKNYDNSNISDINGYRKALELSSLFKENDLIFIKYEYLNSENNNLNDSNLIKGYWWDLIGLIDTTFIEQQNDFKIILKIKGRDLVKLLIEDNNFFIAYQLANQRKTVFGGNSSKIFKRLFTTGEYCNYFVKSLRSIENTLGWITSQLTNIQVITNECLSTLQKEYGEDWNKEFVFTKNGEKKLEKQKIEGIWGLIDILIDEKITHYRIVDPSITNPEGSILQQIQKVCQTPFVECLFDTYKDKYKIIARKPPFDYNELIESYYIEIEPIFCISDNLNFDTDVHTVFQFEPQGALLGGNNSIALSYLPMIVLDEYVKIWGNKLYHAVSNYMDYKVYLGKSSSSKKQFIADLIWLVKTECIKPFTRKGTITLRGDRRIKCGQWIYYKKSNEIFYVEGVNNTIQIINGQIDRRTTLSVSRGMVKDFVYRELSATFEATEQGKANYRKPTKANYNYSYFNIIDETYLITSLLNNLIDVNNAYTIQRQQRNSKGKFEGTDSCVNKDIFEFFLNGRQFSEKGGNVEINYKQNTTEQGQNINGKGKGKNGTINISLQDNYSGPYIPEVYIPKRKPTKMESLLMGNRGINGGNINNTSDIILKPIDGIYGTLE